MPDRLVAEGLAEHDREEIASGRLRRYYRITDVGRRRLADEVERQAANARLAGVVCGRGVARRARH